MLRRINSLIKGTKVQPDSTEQFHQQDVPPAAPSTQQPVSHVPIDISHAVDSERMESWDGQASVSNNDDAKESQFGEKPEVNWKEGQRPMGEVWVEVARKKGVEYGQFILDGNDTYCDQIMSPEVKSDSLSETTSQNKGVVTRPELMDSSPLGKTPGVSNNGDTADFRSPKEGERTSVPTILEVSGAGSKEFAGTVVCTRGNPIAAVVREPSQGTAIDIPDADTGKAFDLESCRYGNDGGTSVWPTTSNFSTDSMTECCRICQQHTEESLIELGCYCRGELAKAHRSCIEQWFGNKGSNKCEVCQHVATNVPAPATQPMPHFWVWRIGGTYGGGAAIPQRAGGARFHPLWAALLILVAGLLFDVLISIFLGASALPVNIIIGVLVVLGLGTAARLILECWHERAVQRNIQRMEMEPFSDLHENFNLAHHPTQLQTQASLSQPPSREVPQVIAPVA